jgi:hypothetical protein
LLVVGPGRGFVLGIHKANFVVWLAATGIHVLAYLGRVPRLLVADWQYGETSTVAGSLARRTLLAGALVAGAILALVTLRYAQPWTQWVATFHGHDH